jgi:hypothetical protein
MMADDYHGSHVNVHPQSKGGVHTVSLLERRIDEGLAFSATHTVTVGSGTAVSVLITTPATGAYHMVIECESKKAGTFVLQEGPGATGGTAITSVNLNRQSDETDTLTLLHTTTYTTAGTVMETHVIGGTDGPVICTKPYILNVSTKYIALFTADASTTETVMNLFYHRES